jgi:hypothetical protein
VISHLAILPSLRSCPQHGADVQKTNVKNPRIRIETSGSPGSTVQAVFSAHLHLFVELSKSKQQAPVLVSSLRMYEREHA